MRLKSISDLLAHPAPGGLVKVLMSMMDPLSYVSQDCIGWYGTTAQVALQ